MGLAIGNDRARPAWKPGNFFGGKFGRQRLAGHGAYIFTNVLGGRVAVVPWDASVSFTPVMDVHRAAQLNRLTGWLAGGRETGRAAGGAWLVPQFLHRVWSGWSAAPVRV